MTEQSAFGFPARTRLLSSEYRSAMGYM